MKIGQLIRENLLLILIFLVATILRTWDLSNSLILFDDAGHDLLVAQQAIEDKNLPLLGIPSSVPRFRQGPVTIWYEMLIMAIFGQNVMAIGLGFVITSLLALVVVYEFCDQYLNKRISILATYMMALSPFAIAQARMPYHTNPIPLATALYLFALVRLFQKKKHSLFLAVLAWAFLFQFELATFPTFLVIIWVMYRTKQLKFDWSKLKQVSLALLLGLWPQILHDLKNQFSQLGLFFVWVGYRIVSLFGGEHSFSFRKVATTVGSYELYAGRIFSTDSALITLVVSLCLVFAFWQLMKQWRSKKLPPALEVISIFTLILTVGYFLHGNPSEAYFPPYIVLLPLLLAFALAQLFKKKSALLMVLLLVWGLINIKSVLSHRFFVSNTQPFSYGCSVKQQLQVAEFIIDDTRDSFKLATTREMGKFAAAFDNLRWLSQDLKNLESSSAKKYYYLEDQNSPLRHELNLKVRHFGCHDVYFYE